MPSPPVSPLVQAAKLSTLQGVVETLGWEYPAHWDYWFRRQQDVRQIFIEIPRRHGKSRGWSVIYPLRSLIRDPSEKIILASETVGQASRWIRETRDRIEARHSPFGWLKPDRPRLWTESAIQVEGAGGADPSIMAVGIDSSDLGSGATKLIIDDLVSEKNSRTHYQREKVKEWFYGTLLGMLDGDTLVVVGTPWHEDDLYSEFRDNPEWVHIRLPAEKPANQPIPGGLYNNPDGVLWPTVRGREWLENKRREIGRIEYARNFLLDLKQVRGGLVTNEYLHQFYELPPISPPIIGVDPSIGKSEMSDYTAMVAAGAYQNRCYILGECEGRWSMDERCKKIEWFAQLYNSTIIAVEETSMSMDFIAYLEQRFRGRYVIRRVRPSGRDKVARLKSIMARIEDGTILFSPGVHDLRDELLQFPNGSYDDLVDAFIYAASEALKPAVEGGFVRFNLWGRNDKAEERRVGGRRLRDRIRNQDPE